MISTITNSNQYVVYYRVSTQKQGASGLGLEAQKASVISFLGIEGKTQAEFTDIESGKNNNRPQLLQAIDYCQQNGARLLIAKLDRLTRNIAFIFTLRDSGVSFVCADMPQANTLTIGVMASMAQHERELISERTRQALAQKKKAGFQLGTPANLTDEATQRGLAVRQQNARMDPNNRRALALTQSMRQAGQSWTTIANTLNKHGFRTRRGKLFQAVQVQRILKLLEV
ncbi:recombinase family protein [Larkinella sp. C7]|uniref:recombinase family protein n=1 Tax=Larkinella sp. C7 TaxID=2576607 RepID=UPI00111100C7|nr:recombinase family protein [Larkinella sp. C7]